MAYLTPSRPAPPVPVQRQRSFEPGATSGLSYSSNSSAGTVLPNGPQNSYVPPSSSNAGASTTIVRRGWVSVKEEGLRSWIWSKRWLVLREQTLTMHKNEAGATIILLGLKLTPSEYLTDSACCNGICLPQPNFECPKN